MAASNWKDHGNRGGAGGRTSCAQPAWTRLAHPRSAPTTSRPSEHHPLARPRGVRAPCASLRLRPVHRSAYLSKRSPPIRPHHAPGQPKLPYFVRQPTLTPPGFLDDHAHHAHRAQPPLQTSLSTPRLAQCVTPSRVPQRGIVANRDEIPGPIQPRRTHPAPSPQPIRRTPGRSRAGGRGCSNRFRRRGGLV